MTSLHPEIPVLYYDGDCSFCRLWVDYWKQRTGEAVRFTPYQSLRDPIVDLPPGEFKRSVQLIMPDGTIQSAAGAVLTILSLARCHRWIQWLYLNLPGFDSVCEWSYRFIASRRNAAYTVTKVLWGIPLRPSTYRHTRQTFLRCIALIYCVAFISLSSQVTGLVGSHGILPASHFLKAVHAQFGDSAVFLFPSLVWLRTSDAFLQLLCYAGAALSIVMFIGMYPRLCALLLWVFYFSLYIVGQDFLSFQWDVLLLETGFLAIALAPLRSMRSYAVQQDAGLLWLPRLLLFKLMFQSGVVKLTAGDPHWADLTALRYHFETQCIPTPVAWYAHQLPAWILGSFVVAMFIIEILVPFLIFAPRRLRFAAGWILIGFQLLIILTGNYTFFNYLTIALCVTLFDDVALSHVVPKAIRQRLLRGNGEVSHFVRLPGALLALSIVSLNVASLLDVLVGPREMPVQVTTALQWSSHYSIVNSYGLFRVMTRSRPEINVEGSNDGRNWRAYEFRYKAGDTLRAPPWVAPHQPRLDWQMWFAALGTNHSNDWFAPFMMRLLEGSPDVLDLLAHNPFPASPPRYVRALLYDYRFTTGEQRRATNAWWRRDYLGLYMPMISLKRNP